jgi:hypothetical protein
VPYDKGGRHGRVERRCVRTEQWPGEFGETLEPRRCNREKMSEADGGRRVFNAPLHGGDGREKEGEEVEVMKSKTGFTTPDKPKVRPRSGEMAMAGRWPAAGCWLRFETAASRAKS